MLAADPAVEKYKTVSLTFDKNDKITLMELKNSLTLSKRTNCSSLK